MQIAPFRLERYFAQYEFKTRFLLSPSDCESLSSRELLQMADAEMLELWNDLRLGYTESQGHPDLRAEISRMYDSIISDHVVVAAPEEAIFIAMNTLLKPGDHIVTLFPGYQSLSEIARAIGCEVSPWSFELNASGWHLDLNRLASLLTERTRLLVLNFPHNPTGYLPTHDELRAIVEIGARTRRVPFSAMRCTACLNTIRQVDCQQCATCTKKAFRYPACQKHSPCPVSASVGWQRASTY